MSYKILTKNGVDNTNIDGARSEYFNTGMRDGIVQGILNEGNLMNNTSNGILFDTCELRVAGHRILIDEPYYKTFENIPNSNIRYSLIAQIIVDDDYNVDFSFLVQTSSTLLRQDNLYANLNGSGIYQVEIGRFTQQSDGIITDIIRTIDVITGASSVDGTGKINIGNVITEKIDYSLNAEIDIDSRYDEEQEKEFIDFKFSLPVDISSEIKNRTLADENLQSQINKKVDNIDGKGLSTNDFTNDYKSQIESNTSARHTHSNKELLDTYDQTNANIKDSVSKKHSHSNKTLLDTYTQTEANIKDAVDKKHTHSNKTLLDNTTASYTSEEKTKLSGLSNYDDSEVKADIIANANSIIAEASARESADTTLQLNIDKKVDKVTGKGLSTNDFTNDYKLQIESNTSARHTHSNKALLDTYTQTETNLADAVSKKHSHSNKSVLDNTTASYTTEEKTKLSGIASGAEVNVQADLNVTDTTSDAYIKNKPTIPEGVKLYSATGQNTDGAMSQKATTDELNKKAKLDASNLSTTNVTSWKTKLGISNLETAITVTKGLATLNSTYVSSGNIVYYVVNKTLCIVTFNDVTFKNTAQSNDAVIASGLPVVKSGDSATIVNLTCWGGTQQTARYIMDTDFAGKIRNWWSAFTPTTSQKWSGTAVYRCEEI